MNYAVLGGGISGLATAHYLAKSPRTKGLVVLEASSRLGGWIRTQRFPDNVFYELGPRTIRPSGHKGANTLALVEELGLADKVKPVPYGHPTTKNRFIYVNQKLHKLPSSFFSLLTRCEPFDRPLLFAGLRDLITGPKVCEDDSLYDFVARRFGSDVAQYAVDPMVRGICAGDAREISADSFLFGPLFRMEQRDGGILRSLIKRAVRSSSGGEGIDGDVGPNVTNSDLVQKARKEKWNIWSLDGGLQTLVEALELRLKRDGIDVRLNCGEAARIVPNEKNPSVLSVLGCGVDEMAFDHGFVCIPACQANGILDSRYEDVRQLLKTIPYVDVAVVNVEFASKIGLSEADGAFGLLVPSSQSDVKILGIVFDTCSFPQGDDRTILTVMMGGKWFQELFGNDPNIEDLEEIALSEIRTILGVSQEPCRVLCNIHRRCIAQYTVGHNVRVRKLREEVSKQGIPVSLVGTSYDGAGVNDAIMSAKKHVAQFLQKSNF